MASSLSSPVLSSPVLSSPSLPAQSRLVTDPSVLSLIPVSAMTGGPWVVTVYGGCSATFYTVEDGQVRTSTDKEIWNTVMNK